MKSAAETWEERVRIRAYHVWEASGRPSGRDEEFWRQACEMIGADDDQPISRVPTAPAKAGPAEPAAAQTWPQEPAAQIISGIGTSRLTTRAVLTVGIVARKSNLSRASGSVLQGQHDARPDYRKPALALATVAKR